VRNLRAEALAEIDLAREHAEECPLALLLLHFGAHNESYSRVLSGLSPQHLAATSLCSFLRVSFKGLKLHRDVLSIACSRTSEHAVFIPQNGKSYCSDLCRKQARQHDDALPTAAPADSVRSRSPQVTSASLSTASMRAPHDGSRLSFGSPAGK
jgi:hypothetical protein